MANKKRVDLHISVDIYNELKQIANKKDITITTLLKLIIHDYLTNKTEANSEETAEG